MSAPNLKSPTTITGKTARYAVTASLAAALSNASSSGKALKINIVSKTTLGAAGKDKRVYLKVPRKNGKTMVCYVFL